MKILTMTLCFVFTFLFFCTTQNIHAQMWTQLSPLPINVVTTITSVGNNLYAGTSEGLYRSANKGESWDNIGDFNNRTIVNLSVNANELFVCPVSAGIWLFANNEWKDISSNLPLNSTIYSVVRKGTSLFAGTNSNGVYRSENNGTTWDVVGLPNLEVRSIVIVDTILFAGALDFEGTKGSLFRSEDNGQTWIRSDTGLTSAFSKIISVNKNNMYVGTLGSGVFRSSDGGKHWEEALWGLGDLGVNAMVVEDGYILAGTANGGVFISRDSSKTWLDANYKLTPKKINDLLVFDGVPYCATDNGIWSCDLNANGIEDFIGTSTDWNIVPQPARNHITISLPVHSTIMSADLYDSMGNSINIGYNFSENILSYSLENLSSGTYYAHISVLNGKRAIVPIVKL